MPEIKEISPYVNLPTNAFWKSAIEKKSALNTSDFFESSKWKLKNSDKIATAGSCFAQHIGRQLRKTGFELIDKEPPPRSLLEHFHQRYGYGMYSARYGNIYTTRQLLQLAKEALVDETPRIHAWRKQDCFIDALRPNVEPRGFESVDRLQESRAYHIKCVREMLLEMDVFIFTMGLTEAWECQATKTIFPTAPGTIGGSLSEIDVKFVNFDYSQVESDLLEFIELVRKYRQSKNEIKVLLTVSPVPLTATASGNHIHVATTYSKSVLRAVAGACATRMDFVQYFPSYEIITSPQARGIFYESNLRSVTSEGVSVVMKTFESAFGGQASKTHEAPLDVGTSANDHKSADEVACEDALLEVFAQ